MKVDIKKMKQIEEMINVDLTQFLQHTNLQHQPFVMRGLVKEWPIVQAGLKSAHCMFDYLGTRAKPSNVELFAVDKSHSGALKYDSNLEETSFVSKKVDYSLALARLFDVDGIANDQDWYMGSVEARKIAEGFTADNRIDWFPKSIEPRFWLSNKVQVSAHYDTSDNLACCVYGRRRFILFPPDQVGNLYIGPIDQTLAGRPASLVDFADVDEQRYPRFSEALESASYVDLFPGDVLFIPNLWWHHVSSLESVNLLVNYWWSDANFGGGRAYNSMLHSMLTISQLPRAQRAAWKAFYEHYVFRTQINPGDHIPESKRGVLGEITPQIYVKIAQYVARSFRKKN